MENATQKNSRQGIRLLLGLIALCLFGYCAEIFIMGAPEFKKHSYRTFYRDKDPIPFWTQFSLFAAAGAAAAYVSINWKKGLPMVEALDERDRKRLEDMGPNYAQWVNRKREIQFVAFIFAGAVVVALLIGLAI